MTAQNEAFEKFKGQVLNDLYKAESQLKLIESAGHEIIESPECGVTLDDVTNSVAMLHKHLTTLAEKYDKWQPQAK